jgi:carbon monoxide dehydrogenase subunit G
MKYTNEIVIDLPREKVIEKFDNVDNMKYWMPGLVSFEPIEGKPGQTGAKSRLVFQMGRRRIEMVETITKRALPDEFSGTYEANGVWNAQANRFQPEGEGKTRWISETEFRFSGFMRIIGFLMPGAFRKQSARYQVHFKEFAETGKQAKA